MYSHKYLSLITIQLGYCIIFDKDWNSHPNTILTLKTMFQTDFSMQIHIKYETYKNIHMPQMGLIATQNCKRLSQCLGKIPIWQPPLPSCKFLLDHINEVLLQTRHFLSHFSDNLLLKSIKIPYGPTIGITTIKAIDLRH